MKKDIALSDTKYFDLFIGKRMLKEQVFGSKGTIPIYSGSVTIPFGFADTSNIDDFDHDYIIWGIDDAVFDFALIPKGRRFVITDHCGAIKILTEDILAEYLFYFLQLKKRSLGFGWSVRASMTNMKKVKVSIPTNADSSFDISEQTELIPKFMEVRNTTAKIRVMNDDLKNTNLEVDIDTKDMLEIPVSELFDLSVRTNHSDFTKAFIDSNKGDIPVFSASQDENSVDYGYVKDNLKGIKYFENCLTWNIDGSVGKAFYREGKFTLSEKVIPLVLEQKYKECVNPEYVKMLLEQRALEYGFHYSHKAGKGKIKDISIPFPSKSKSGCLVPDFSSQTEIVQKCNDIEAIRNITLDKLQKLLTSSLSVIVE